MPNLKYPPGNGDLFFYKAVSAVSTQAIPVLPGTRMAGIEIRGTGGMTAGFPTAVLARYNSDAGSNYKWVYDTASTIAVPAVTQASQASPPQDTSMLLGITGSAPATDIVIRVEFDVEVTTGTARSYRSWCFTRGAADATTLRVQAEGCWTNTASPVTEIGLIFGSAFTGKIYGTLYA